MTTSRQAVRLPSNPFARMAAALGGLARSYVRNRSLAKLHDLDDRLLRDVGLTRADILRMRRHW